MPPPDLRGRDADPQGPYPRQAAGPGRDLERVAQHGSGLTGADLANLATRPRSWRAATARVHRPGGLRRRLERVVAGLQTRKVITDHEKRVVAWHEAGHALVSELLPTVDKVQKVSIVPRGKALGYTLNLPQEDRYLKSRQELIDYMKVLLGGRVAEQITFGRVTTGASDDLKGSPRSLDRWSTSTGWGPRSAPTRSPPRLQRLRDDAPEARRGGPGDRGGGVPRGPAAAHRPPRPARPDRGAAARQRGRSSTTRSPEIMAGHRDTR